MIPTGNPNDDALLATVAKQDMANKQRQHDKHHSDIEQQIQQLTSRIEALEEFKRQQEAK